MKRFALVLCAAFLVTGCGGGGGGNDFNGRWLVNSKVVRNACGGTWAAQGEIQLSQDGTEIWLQWKESNVEPDSPLGRRFAGTCDPKARTFSIPYTTALGTPAVWEGRALDDDQLAGTRRSTGGCSFEISWTADRISGS